MYNDLRPEILRKEIYEAFLALLEAAPGLSPTPGQTSLRSAVS